jgi:hypothetical protein
MECETGAIELRPTIISRMTPAKFIFALYLFYEWVLWVPTGWIALLVLYCLYKLYKRSPKWKRYETPAGKERFETLK